MYAPVTRLLWVSEQKQLITVFVMRSRPSKEYRLLSVSKKARRLCDSTGGEAEDVAGDSKANKFYFMIYA